MASDPTVPRVVCRWMEFDIRIGWPASSMSSLRSWRDFWQPIEDHISSIQYRSNNHTQKFQKHKRGFRCSDGFTQSARIKLVNLIDILFTNRKLCWVLHVQANRNYQLLLGDFLVKDWQFDIERNQRFEGHFGHVRSQVRHTSTNRSWRLQSLD